MRGQTLPESGKGTQRTRDRIGARRTLRSTSGIVHVMRWYGLLVALLWGCAPSTAPAPLSPAPQPATASAPQLGRTADATRVTPQAEPEPAPPAPVTAANPWPTTPVEPPDLYRVHLETTAGDFVVEVQRDLAPHGAKRFFNLVVNGYFDDVTFFRAIDGFMVQFGLHGDPAVNTAWREQTIQDDPVATTNARGTISFAKSAQPNSATTQLFINLGDNPQLDGMGFAPIGRVVEGMQAVDAIYKGYGEGAPRGHGPSQADINTQGEAHLARFPKLTRIRTATIEPAGP